MGRVKKAAPTLRQEKAELTRRRIGEAARRLFVSRGYGATTLEAVAADAGVAVQTVYAVYGSKAAILRALRESLLRDPAAEGLYRQALAERDPVAKLDLAARSIRARWESGHDLVAVNEMAATTDADLRREVEAILATRRDGLAQLARTLEKGLARGITVAGAVAILDALTLPSVYAALVGTHAWRPEAYETWLATSLKHALLG